MVELQCKTVPAPAISVWLEKASSNVGAVQVKLSDQAAQQAYRVVFRYCAKANVSACTQVLINGTTSVSLGVPLQFEDIIKQYSFRLRVYDDEDELVRDISPNSKFHCLFTHSIVISGNSFEQ